MFLMLFLFEFKKNSLNWLFYIYVNPNYFCYFKLAKAIYELFTFLTFQRKYL